MERRTGLPGLAVGADGQAGQCGGVVVMAHAVENGHDEVAAIGTEIEGVTGHLARRFHQPARQRPTPGRGQRPPLPGLLRAAAVR
jgi:hypothetical protein